MRYFQWPEQMGAIVPTYYRYNFFRRAGFVLAGGDHKRGTSTSFVSRLWRAAAVGIVTWSGASATDDFNLASNARGSRRPRLAIL